MAKNNTTFEIFKHAFLTLVLLMAFVGIYLMINVSLKDNEQFARGPWLPHAPFHWENFAFAWHVIAPNIWNTIFVAFTTIILSMVVSLMAAYFFAKFKVPGSSLLFYIFLILMMYPGVANMVPVFKLISSLGLYNSFGALIIPAIVNIGAIYILRNFIEDIPNELFDAAEVDGCNMLGQIWHIVIPMSMPIIGTLSIVNLIGIWNSFVGPLIFLRDSNKQLISVALLHLEGEYTKEWGQLMAGYTIASIPLIIIFIFCMKLFIKGLSAGAVKG